MRSREIGGLRTRLGWLVPTLIKSIQSGTITIAAASTSNTATITAVNTNNAWVQWVGESFPQSSADPGVIRGRVTLTNSTTVTAERSDGGGAGDALTVGYTVIELYPGIVRYVEQANFTITGDSSTFTLAKSVNSGRTMIVWRGYKGGAGASAAGLDVDARVALTAADTLTGTRGTGSHVADLILGVTVVEF